MSATAPALAVLEALPDAKLRTPWSEAPCPAHEDDSPSFGWKVADDGAVVLKCQAGCTSEAIVAALGIEMRDLFAPKERKPRPRVVRTTEYEIRDAAGELQAVHVRLDRSDGSKLMPWRLPDGTTEDGLQRRSVTSLPLYGSEHVAGWAADAGIVVVEGEKAADALRAAGIRVLATVTGAEHQPDRAALEVVRGRSVTLWPDADAIGRKYMLGLARDLEGIAAGVTWLEPPDDAPKGWDAADLLGLADDPTAALASVRDRIGPVSEMLSADPPVPSGRNEKTLPYITARQLSAETPEHPEAVGFAVARGCITDLSGKTKLAGKTTWLLQGVRAVLAGSLFMGRPTERSAVVMLSEQGRPSLRAGLERAGLLDADDLYLVLWHDARGLPWPETVAQAIELCHEKGAGLLIVDTLPQFARLAGDAENDSGAALATMEPLQAAAASGLAVLVSRHDRKGTYARSGGDVGETGRGSSAFTGTVDIVVSIRRGGDGERPTVRHLHCLSRFDDLPDELVIDLADDGYRVIGSAAAYAQLEARETILASLPSAGSEGLTMAELVTETEARRTTVQAVIEALIVEGKVARTGTGKRGDAYRYTVSAELPEVRQKRPAETAKLSAGPTWLSSHRSGEESGPTLAETPAETAGDLTTPAEGIFGGTWVNGHDDTWGDGTPLPPPPGPSPDDMPEATA